MRGSAADPTALVRVAQMEEADRLTVQAGTPGIDLMQNAGSAVAREIMRRLTEFMGSEVLVHFRLNRDLEDEDDLAMLRAEDSRLAKVDGVTVGKPMVARLGTRCPAVAGQELTLWTSRQALQLFDAETGATLG